MPCNLSQKRGHIAEMLTKACKQKALATTVFCILLASTVVYILRMVPLANETALSNTIRLESYINQTSAAPSVDDSEMPIAIPSNHSATFGPESTWKSVFWRQVLSDLKGWHSGFSIDMLEQQHQRYSSGKDVVYIHGKKVQMKGCSTHKSKRRLWVSYFEKLIHSINVPDVLFLINFSSKPASTRPVAPILSMAKSNLFRDVLYPNPYFAAYLRHQKQLLKLGNTPWTMRSSVAFWRGACAAYRGSRPRVELVRLAKATNSCDLDVAFTRKCEAGTWPETMRKMVDSLPVAKKVNYRRMIEFKYVVRIPKYCFSRINLRTSAGTCL